MSDDGIVLGRINTDVRTDTQLRALVLVLGDFGEFGRDISLIAHRGAEELAALRTRLAEVEAENGRLREALMYYGSTANYAMCLRKDGQLTFPVYEDRGRYARITLQQEVNDVKGAV